MYQDYEEVFQRLNNVSPKERDAMYLLTLMKTKDAFFEAMYEYQDGLRGIFKTEFARLWKGYEQMSKEEKSLLLAAGFLACVNKTLLAHKYAPLFEKRYEELKQGKKPEEEILNITEEIKHYYEERKASL